MLGLVGFFYVIGLLSRQPAVYSDAIKEIECVSTLGMLLAIGLGGWWGGFYVFTCLWISNLISPYGMGEDLMYLVMDSINMTLLVILVPLLFVLTGGQIITLMFWFYVLRAIMYIVEVPFVKRATIHSSIFLTIMGFFIAITQAYVVLYLLAGPAFDVLGVTGWTFGVMPMLNPVK